MLRGDDPQPINFNSPPRLVMNGISCGCCEGILPACFWYFTSCFKAAFPTLSSCMAYVPRQLDDNGCLDPVQAHLFQVVFLDVRRLGWASLRNNGAR